eukprot:CAMPEP_0113380764 /NCGR_PEP_ID=MMETSP0013_2-20120614/4935_1 /TAXON_ID=2843 ORGANISM="Skeletonema costatum, Strain 1716" /NCGR_SAMPLE_ID=MMETSP0013_2 /ASSEMBLY_ACC=CAM_ASM_000158 /LENGTH=299 /DNA_ID=CAMNT_0000263131 /DNA_START=6 /DNA_END=901 /DNA_ORIENTATION=+ /assembly_acc=CAM_ASM_000158
MSAPPLPYERKPSNTTPSAFSARNLSQTRLRSNSHGPLAQDISAELTEAEVNSIAPPAPIYKIVLTGGPCGGKMSAPPLPYERKPSNTTPSAFSARNLSQTRLRSNSHGPLAQDISAELTQAEVNSIAPPAPIYKIVLTGGPCGGKTTSMARLSPYLRERGFEVITCPEAFSLLVNNGMAFDYLSAVKGMDIVVQDTVMDMQIGMEDGFERVLRARGKPAVLLCDRGLMDGSAYMKDEDWNKLMQKREIDCVSELREGRYNAVFHLVTAAEGAEEYYTLENNAVRTESPELARSLDSMT